MPVHLTDELIERIKESAASAPPLTAGQLAEVRVVLSQTSASTSEDAAA